MRAKLLLLLPVMLFLTQCAGAATSMLGIPTEGVTSADYKSEEQVRVAAQFGHPLPNQSPFEVALDKTVEMIAAKDFRRFALIRNKCQTTSLRATGKPLVTSCVLWAKMLQDGESVAPKGSKDEVVYFTISENGVASKEQ